jgi:hypothetical protein
MKKLTTKQFLEKFTLRYVDNLGLDLSGFIYDKAKIPAKVRCIKHNHTYTITPDGLMTGVKGCLHCKSESISSSQKYNNDDFVKKSLAVHGDKYNYSLVVYKNYKTKVKIICKKHGEFEQNPQGHWAGHGCPHPECSYQSLRKTTSEFVKDAISVHGNRYDYSKVVYLNNYSKLTVNCKIHGAFVTTRTGHIWYQRGCPKCYPGNRSWVEIQWLNSLGISDSDRQKRVKLNGKHYLVDGLVGNTVYEFWGDYWHGNPKVFDLDNKNTTNGKTFRDLYNNTMKKRKMILDAGYQLVEIWEHDFRKVIKDV